MSTQARLSTGSLVESPASDLSSASRSILHPAVCRTHPGLASLLLIAVVLTGMYSRYTNSATHVRLEVNGSVWVLRTHQRSIGAVLREAGVSVRPEDIIIPNTITAVKDSLVIRVWKARPIVIDADGQLRVHYSHSDAVSDVLREVGVDFEPPDAIFLDGKRASSDRNLPQYQWQPSRWPLLARILPTDAERELAWTRIRLQRAIPLSINDGGIQIAAYTLARTVGEVLADHQVTVYLADRVQPAQNAQLTAGMHVEIQRAKPVTINADGRQYYTRVQARNVGQLLSEAGIDLLGRDYVVPSLDAPIAPDMEVRVIRVIDEWILETKSIAYETHYRPDASLALDQYRTDQPGESGVQKRRIHVVYEDGVEREREITDEWLEQKPTARQVSYGTQISTNELSTPDGVLRYWRKIRMLATSYNAPTAGKPLTHPQYGITRLGWRARKGIVAVDPQVVALGTQVYVPGYGLATAADTGSAIKGRRIDLCYDDDNLVLWKSWVDVYVLEPVPLAAKITWMLPNYPREIR